jgi:hypothetical protein
MSEYTKQPCRMCGADMDYSGRTIGGRSKRPRLGLVWICPKCKHSAWTEVGKKEWNAVAIHAIAPKEQP